MLFDKIYNGDYLVEFVFLVKNKMISSFYS